MVERRVEPGLHLALPPGVDAVTKVKTGEVLRLQVAGDGGAPMSLVTGDENLIETTLIVQYRISSLASYLFHADDPTALLTQAVRAAMVDEIARRTVEEVLTSGKASVQNEVRRKAQTMLQAYSTGLSLVAVTIQAVNPPPEAVAAFLEVSDARAQAARAVNEAQTRRESSLNLARGRAERSLAEARTWADQRQQKARGAASRFEQVMAQARRTPQQTRTDFYLAMVRKVLPKARIIVLAPGEKPRIDIYLTQPGSAATPPGAAAGGEPASSQCWAAVRPGRRRRSRSRPRPAADRGTHRSGIIGPSRPTSGRSPPSFQPGAQQYQARDVRPFAQAAGRVSRPW